MKNIFKIAIFSMVMFCLVACSNPLNRKYNEATLSTDLKDIAKARKLDSTEAKGMILYIFRAKFVGEELDGKTYADIVDSAKKLQTTKKP